jgi:hypothetical protein
MLKTFSKIIIKSGVPKLKLSEISNLIGSKGVQISFMNEQKEIKKYYVFDYYIDNETYMSIDNAQHPYSIDVPLLQGHFQSLLNTNINFWRDNVIFRYRLNDISSVTVDYPSEPTKSFKLSRLDNGIWTLTDIKDLQTFPLNNKRKVIEYLSSFGNVAFEKLVSGVPHHSSDSIRLSKPLYIISLKDKENRLIVMKGYPIAMPGLKNDEGSKLSNDPDRLFVFINNDTILTVAKYLDIDPISRDLDYFLTK